MTRSSTCPILHPNFEEFLAMRQSEGAAADTIALYERTLRRFSEWLTGEGLDPFGLQPLDAARYVNEALTRGHGDWSSLAPASRAKALTILRSAYTFAVDWDLTNRRTPFRSQLRVRQPGAETPQRFFTPDELRAIISACEDEREFLVCTTLAFTGLRCDELCNLRWTRTVTTSRLGQPIERSWVDFDNRLLRVCGKGEKIRRIPIHPALYSVMKNAGANATRGYVVVSTRGNRLSRVTLGYLLNRIFDRAGVNAPGTGAHAFRRSFNNNLCVTARGYTNERLLLMGHSLARTEGVNAVYQSYTDEQLAEVIRKLYVDSPILPR